MGGGGGGVKIYWNARENIACKTSSRVFCGSISQNCMLFAFRSTQYYVHKHYNTADKIRPHPVKETGDTLEVSV